MNATTRLKNTVTDIFMPVMDGLELVSKLYERASHPKVIVMSGGSRFMDSSFSLKAVKEYSVDAVLHKPVTPKNIMKRVVAALH